MLGRARQQSRPPSIVQSVLIVGAIGFAAGFFGPIALNPDANQGPLVGIFISGPAGACLGLLLWGVCRLLGVLPARQWHVLWAFSAVLALVTLGVCLPGPMLRGYVVEVQIEGCESPAQAADKAIAYWTARVARVTWAAPRPGWQADARRRLDQAVVLDVTLLRRNDIYASRKPWNRGALSSSGWHPVNEPASYYARYAGGACAEYPLGLRSVRFVPHDAAAPKAPGPGDWPPRDVASFLNLAPLEPVTAPYQKLAGD